MRALASEGPRGDAVEPPTNDSEQETEAERMPVLFRGPPQRSADGMGSEALWILILRDLRCPASLFRARRGGRMKRRTCFVAWLGVGLHSCAIAVLLGVWVWLAAPNIMVVTPGMRLIIFVLLPINVFVAWGWFSLVRQRGWGWWVASVETVIALIIVLSFCVGQREANLTALSFTLTGVVLILILWILISDQPRDSQVTCGNRGGKV